MKTFLLTGAPCGIVILCAPDKHDAVLRVMDQLGDDGVIMCEGEWCKAGERNKYDYAVILQELSEEVVAVVKTV